MEIGHLHFPTYNKYQNLENLCIFGIKVFPTPSDVLFIANKHHLI